jgi:Uncharacterized protein conserved in bacteria (DUF2188)
VGARVSDLIYVLISGEVDTSKDQLFIERRPRGDYAIRRPNSQRASDVLPTQREAIERARELNPSGRPLVERVRNTDVGRRDKWRSA